jgi:hypothetical protein
MDIVAQRTPRDQTVDVRILPSSAITPGVQFRYLLARYAEPILSGTIRVAETQTIRIPGSVSVCRLIIEDGSGPGIVIPFKSIPPLVEVSLPPQFDVTVSNDSTQITEMLVVRQGEGWRSGPMAPGERKILRLFAHERGHTIQGMTPSPFARHIRKFKAVDTALIRIKDGGFEIHNR